MKTCEKTINYDPSSHIFYTQMKNGEIDPYTDVIVYDGGELSDDWEDWDPDFKEDTR